MKIGDKVLCINDKGFCVLPIEIRLGVRTPKAGEVYTIRSLDYVDSAVTLEEIVNPRLRYMDGLGEAQFYIWRFIKWNPEEIELELKETVRELI